MASSGPINVNHISSDGHLSIYSHLPRIQLRVILWSWWQRGCLLAAALHSSLSERFEWFMLLWPVDHQWLPVEEQIKSGCAGGPLLKPAKGEGHYGSFFEDKQKTLSPVLKASNIYPTGETKERDSVKSIGRFQFTLQHSLPMKNQLQLHCWLFQMSCIIHVQILSNWRNY